MPRADRGARNINTKVRDLVADLEREETLKRLQGREQILLRFSRFF